MHIAILGGSFNPPHLGHILVARQVLDFTDVDQLWFVPAYRHTFDKPLADTAHRLAMTEKIELEKTRACDIEYKYKLDGQSIKLVRHLKTDHHNYRFTFIIGSDQLPTFHKWGSWQELVQEIKFLVVPRAGYPAVPLYPNMQVLDNPLFISTNISSSLVRDRLARSLSVNNIVPQDIIAYIRKHKLYNLK